jgi:signal transduction histidine kinase
MLRRLIREDIEIEMNLFPQILHIKADPGQIEQILINLIVNARDAIGERQDNVQKKIKISTRPVKIDESFSKENPDSQVLEWTMKRLIKYLNPFTRLKKKVMVRGLACQQSMESSSRIVDLFRSRAN